MLFALKRAKKKKKEINGSRWTQSDSLQNLSLSWNLRCMWIRQSRWLWWTLSGTPLLPYCEDLYPHCLLMPTRLMINTWLPIFFFFFLLSTITVYSPHWIQPNNHIYLDQLLKAISWRPTIIIFWGDDLLLTIFFLVLITKCHLNHYRKYNDKKNNEKFFPLGYTILLVKYELLIYL